MSFFFTHFKSPFKPILTFNKGWLITFIITFLSVLGASTALLFFVYQNKYYPGLKIDGVAIGGKTTAGALVKLEEKQPSSINGSLTIVSQNKKRKLELNQVVLGRNFDQALTQAFEIGRRGHVFKRLSTILRVAITGFDVKTEYKIDQEKLKSSLKQLKEEVDVTAKHPTAILAESGNINNLNIDPGQDGQKIELEPNLDCLEEDLKTNLSKLNCQSNCQIQLQAKVTPINIKLTKDEVVSFKNLAEKFIDRQIIFTNKPVGLEEQLILLSSEPIINLKLADQDLISFLDLSVENRLAGINHQAIDVIVQQWAQEVDQEPINAEFKYDPNTLNVTQFKPHEVGKKLDQEHIKKTIVEIVDQIKQTQLADITQEVYTKELKTKETQPNKTLAKTNDLGIIELIGFGNSYYDHSIPSRINNVKITANRLSLNIVPPGEKFSFNQTIGEISKNTGYQPAYVIKNGRTILGDGGGVCQVSTTLFRALLDSGLDITRRLPHSYRVSYYELDKKPGFDATVYAGDTDLRFINDTNHHLLIFSQANSDDLYMKVEIYGTSDGRTAEISNYRQWGYQPPPPPQYIPDQSLEPGQLKQVDWAASGIKTEFDWTVRNEKGDIIRQKTFHSNYRPWSAKYLQGI